MTSGLLTTVQGILNTTVAANSACLLDPSFAAQGTPQVNFGQPAYPLAYGAAAMTPIVPKVVPTGNSVGVVGATALSSGSNTINGTAGYGNTQGNAVNTAMSPDATIPPELNKLYQILLTMSNATINRF